MRLLKENADVIGCVVWMRRKEIEKWWASFKV
jgi:hypothetical protein